MNFFFSTIGRKIQIAFTGVVLSCFLLFHLLNNLVLFTGPDNFNAMVAILESIKPMIRIMEFCLLGVILIHIINAAYLTIENKKSATKRYKVDSSATSSTNSRTMIISGIIILIFFIIHLKYIWYSYQAHLFVGDETYYDILLRDQLGYLGHTPTAIFYIIAIFCFGE